MALEREPLTAAPPAEGLQRCFSRVCQGERLSIPAWEEISPPFPRGRDRAFRLNGNGTFKDYTVQLQRGKTGAAAASVPPPSLSPPYPPFLSSNTCPGDPPQVSPDPSLVLPGRQGASSKVRGRVGDAGG